MKESKPATRGKKGEGYAAAALLVMSQLDAALHRMEICRAITAAEWMTDPPVYPASERLLMMSFWLRHEV